MNAGDEQTRLLSWLSDVAPTRLGTFYQIIRVGSSLLVAFIVGVSAGAGSAAHGFAISLVLVQARRRRTHNGTAARLSRNLTSFLELRPTTTLHFPIPVSLCHCACLYVQLGTAAFCLCSSAAGDRLEGHVSGIGLTAEALNVLLLFLSQALREAASPQDAANAKDVANATIAGAPAAANATRNATTNFIVEVGAPGTRLQDAALACAFFSILLPLMLTVYDSIFLQWMEVWAKATPESRRRGCAIFALRSLATMPVVFAATLWGGAASLNAAAEVVEDVTDAVVETGQHSRDEVVELANKDGA